VKKILFILPFFILFSCSVQKRKYQKGFYVSNHKTKTQTKKNNSVIVKKEAFTQNLISKPVLIHIEEKIEAEASVTKRSHPIKHPSLIYKDEPCDVMTLKNGEDVNVKILEITSIEIKYKKCDLPDGPLYVIKKSDVFMIKYSNGTKEIFKSDEVTKDKGSVSDKTKKNKTKTTNDHAILSLVFGILGFVIFFGSIAAIVLGDKALKEMKAEPDTYEGKSAAQIGKILGIVGVVLKIALFFLIILSIALII